MQLLHEARSVGLDPNIYKHKVFTDSGRAYCWHDLFEDMQWIANEDEKSHLLFEDILEASQGQMSESRFTFSSGDGYGAKA